MKRTSLRLAALQWRCLQCCPLPMRLRRQVTPPYPTPRTAVSEDSTIYLRDIPAKDTDGAVQLRHMEGKTVSVLGEDATGKYFYIEYESKKGFVRAKDFELTDNTPAAHPGPPAPTPTTYNTSAPLRPAYPRTAPYICAPRPIYPKSPPIAIPT